MRFLSGLIPSLVVLVIGSSSAHALADDVDEPDASPAPGSADDTLLVHVKGVGGAFVEARLPNGTWARACATPCDRPLARSGLYRLNGPSMKASSPFRLVGNAHADLVVEPATIAGRVIGGIIGGLGGVVFFAGLFRSFDGVLTFCGEPPPPGDGPSDCQVQRDRTQQTAQTEGRTLMLAGAGVAVTGALVFAATAGSETRVEVTADGKRDGKRDRARRRVEPRTAAWYAPSRDAQSGVPTPKLPFTLPVLSGSF